MRIAWRRKSWGVGVGLLVAAGGCGLLGGYDFGGYTPGTGGSHLDGGPSGGSGSTAACTQASDCEAGLCAAPACTMGVCTASPIDAGAVCFGGVGKPLESTCDSAGNCRGAPIWARQIRGTTALGVLVSAVAIAGNGDIVVVGISEGDVDFAGTKIAGTKSPDGGPAVLDGFVARLDASGHVLWARGFGNGDYVAPTGVALNADGNVFIAGNARGAPISLLEDGGAPVSGAVLGMFVAELTATGALVWGRRITDSATHSTDVKIAVDDSTVVVVTTFTGDLDFGDGTTASSPTGHGAGLVAVFDASKGGTKKSGLVLVDPATHQSLDDVVRESPGHFLVTGSVQGQPSWSPNTSHCVPPLPPVPAGQAALLLMDIDATGACYQARSFFGSTGSTQGSAIAFQPPGLIGLLGKLGGTAVFDQLSVSATKGIVVAAPQFPPLMTAWAKGFSSPSLGTVSPGGIAVDPGGEVFVAGAFSVELDFGLRKLPATTASFDGFLAAFTGGDGTLVFAHDLPGGATGVAADGSAVVVVGGFAGSGDFGVGPWSVTKPSGGDGYIAKYAR